MLSNGCQSSLHCVAGRTSIAVCGEFQNYFGTSLQMESYRVQAKYSEPNLITLIFLTGEKKERKAMPTALKFASEKERERERKPERGGLQLCSYCNQAGTQFSEITLSLQFH